MNWFTRNSTVIIKSAYILPILIAAGVSISHVIAWYGLTNPISWAIYLSIGIEIAALSALAGITTRIGNAAYIPFIIVTFIQLIGNIFYAYQYIDITSPMFKDWVDLVGGLFGHGDIKFHRQILAYIGGGFIPMISLSFLHLLVSFTNKKIKDDETNDGGETTIIEDEETTIIEDEESIIEENKESKVDLDDVFTPKENIIKKWDDSGFINTGDEELPLEKEIFLGNNGKEVEIDNIEESKPKEAEPEQPIDIEEIIETHKKEKEKKISVDEIKEVKDRRNFSVKIPNRPNKSSNSIERIGTNKTLEKGDSNKITFKKRDDKNR